jgi:glycosyltransferase involved in cell wall biosynthesis
VKLLFDLQALQNESRDRGIGRYVRSLFDAMAKRTDVELYALLNGAMSDTLGAAERHIASRIGSDRILVFPGIGETKLEVSDNLNRWRLSQAAYEAFVAEAGPDVLLTGSVVEGFIDGTSLSLKSPNAPYFKATILYDLIPLMDVDKYLSWDKARDWYFDRIGHVEAADIVLAISESSRGECLQFLDFKPQQAVAISTAIDGTVFNTTGAATRQLLEKMGITKPFVMHTSAIEPRKNFQGLVRAFAALPSKVRNNHQLVLVGNANPAARAELLDLAAQLGLDSGSIAMPGFVPDPDLAQLYRSCRLFVFPSFHEGFGLPALEAMACGCPTIGSNTTSIPEVIGDPAYTFDPTETAAITKAMQHLLTDDQAWRKAKAHAVKQASKFSWDGVADSAVAALKLGLEARSSKRPSDFPSAKRMAMHVADRVDLRECQPDDLEAIAKCLVAAEDELVTKLAAALNKQDMRWRIEGPFDSSYSLALVNRETARAMAELGWTVDLHSTEGPGDFPANPQFLSVNPDLATMYDRAFKSSHEQSFAVSRLLYPPRVNDMAAPVNALHHYAWEESGFPQDWVDEFNSHLTMLTTLSTHVEKIMIDNGVSVPMVTGGCGVDHWDRVKADEDFSLKARGFRFLHVSSCFPRKGIDALLSAYGEAFTFDDDVTLVIKTFDNPHNDVRQQLADLRIRNARYPHVVTIFDDLSDGELKSIYNQCDVLVGPSFAEGYGLPFAEAMLSGIPVITTNWGGQLDFCNAGNSWLVDYHFERARTHFGLWASAWARVDVSSLAQAMRDAHGTDPSMRAEMAARGRSQLLARHRWKHVAERLTAAAATLPKAQRREPRIGWISSWHSKCGIAGYSQHLVDAMDGDITVFAPMNETPLIGKDISIRCWRQTKQDSDLWRVYSHPKSRDIDCFVIQFNYGFFNHTDLSRFIMHAKASAKSVVICLHSTVDPTNVADIEKYGLAWLVPALAQCDRILVHSCDDLNRLKLLGLVDNVCLFPHGVVRREAAASIEAQGNSDLPVIATYGFALPHKGLPETIEALRLLHDRGHKVRLRMVNAEYPVAASAQLIASLKDRIRDLDLVNYVDLHNRFVSDEESFALLTDCDLLLFPYQNTGESSSAAVRYGLATERPVAVTPLAIFGDVEGATFRLSGTRPTDLADGIAKVLEAIAGNTPEAAAIAVNADKWRIQHDYRAVGRRLANMCKALANR